MVNNKSRTRSKKKDEEKDRDEFEEKDKDVYEEKDKDGYEEKDKDGYDDYNDRKSLGKIDQMQKEFDLSDLEMEEIDKFIQSLPVDDNIYYVLEELVKTDSLNVRQKVAFAHALGIFREEGNLRSKKAIVIEIPSF